MFCINWKSESHILLRIFLANSKVQKLNIDLFVLESGKVENQSALQLAKSAFDCFKLLRTEKLFSPNDVIFVQRLCEKTNCEELYTRCTNYALNNKALCFFERMPGMV